MYKNIWEQSREIYQPLNFEAGSKAYKVLEEEGEEANNGGEDD
jgi:hypothetical protein